jgi:glycosyltransferase involved in cell wall biosynthesis
MNVLHVVNVSFVLPYFLGDQLDHFKRKGFKQFIACSPSEDLVEFCQKTGVPFLPVKIQRRISPIVDFVSVLKLCFYIKRNNINFVVGHTPKAAFIAMLASYLCFINRRVYFQHGLMFETSVGLRRLLLEGIENLTVLLASKVVCVSKSVLDYSSSKSLSFSRKCLILNNGSCNGIDALKKFNMKRSSKDAINQLREELNILSSDVVIGYVGRLVNDKGISELLEAWLIIKVRYTNAKLLLVGPFEERDALPGALKNRIISDSTIVHTGFVRETFLYYCLMDIFILPSYREGFPTVVLEASAMELPVITTRSTGCIDSIIDNHTGLYTEISPSDIFLKVDYYLRNSDVAHKHGLNGREFVLSRFQQEAVWDSIEKDVFELDKFYM